MARTIEQILREITADNVFRIAQLVSENEKLKEDVDELTKKVEDIISRIAEKGKDGSKQER
jgi:hypothetical protein